MLERAMKSLGLSWLALGLAGPLPTAAQFGVGANRRNKGSAASFEELNKMAAERMAAEEKAGDAGDLANLENFGDMDISDLMKDLDPNTLQEMVKEGMKDPAIQEMFSGMQGAMDELLKMDKDQLKTQMEEAMSLLTSTDMQKNILGQKDEVLAMMEAQGTVSPEDIAAFREDPAKFEAEMAKAFGQMKDVFSDPKAIHQVVQMMKGFGEVIKDPTAAMSKLGGVLQDALADDDKIEQARMQLLNDPDVAGNKALSDMFGTEEMKEILNDPVKWKKSVKEGQKMLAEKGGNGNEKVGGVGMGEL